MEIEKYMEIIEHLMNKMKASGEEQSFSHVFSNAESTDEKRATAILKYLRKYKMMAFTKGDIHRYIKAPLISMELRSYGNQVFLKDQRRALIYYTRSLAMAPYPTSPVEGEDTKELSLAFANRSALYFLTKNYAPCLKDLEQALLYDYPGMMKYKLEERRAKTYQYMGKKEEARASVQIARELLSKATHLSEDEKQLTADALTKIQTELDSVEAEPSEYREKLRPMPDKSSGQHENIPCAADCVDIKYTADLGRHIVATKDITPGDVLIVEDPFVSVVFPEKWLSHCNYCLKKSDAMIPCQRCHCVMFCSPVCRKTAWEMFHNVECQLAPALTELHSAVCTLLPLRLFLIACSQNGGLTGLYHLVKALEKEEDDDKVKGFDETGKYTSSDYRQIHHLMKHIRRDFNEQVIDAVSAAYILNGLEVQVDFFSSQPLGNFEEVKQSKLKKFAGGLLLKFVEIININTFSVTEFIHGLDQSSSRNSMIGMGIYSASSILDHSCYPNAISTYHNGRTQAIRARRQIKKGDRITIAYGKHFAWDPIEDRRLVNSQKYHFTCNCEACVKKWPTLRDLPSEDDVVFICRVCRTPLPSNVEHVDCRTCGRYYHLLHMEVDTLLLRYRMEDMMDKLAAGYDKDFTSELATYVWILENTVQHPNRLTVTSQDYLMSSLVFLGNYVKDGDLSARINT